MKFILSLLGIMLMILRLSFQHEIELEPNEDEIEQKVTNEIVDSIDFEEYETTKTINIDDSKIENYSDQQAQEGEIDKNKLNQVEYQDKKM